MKILGNISLFIIGLLALTSFYGWYSDDSDERAARQQIEKFVEDLSRRVPLKVDDVTTLKKVELTGEAISFEYFSELSLLLFEAKETALEQQILVEINACSVDLTKRILSQNYTIRHTFKHSISEKKITAIIKSDDCEKFDMTKSDVFADYYIDKMKNILPYEFESGYEFVSLSKNKKTLNLSFRYKEKLSSELNLKEIQKYFQKSYPKEVCENQILKHFLTNGFKIRTIINDKTGAEFYTYDVNIRMC